MNNELKKFLDDELQMELEIQTLGELFEAANTAASIIDTSDSLAFLVYDAAELTDIAQLLEGSPANHYPSAGY